MAQQINRWAVLPSEDTPSHISQIRIFDSQTQAHSHAKVIMGRTQPCLDVDELIKHQQEVNNGC